MLQPELEEQSLLLKWVWGLEKATSIQNGEV